MAGPAALLLGATPPLTIELRSGVVSEVEVIRDLLVGVDGDDDPSR